VSDVTRILQSIDTGDSKAAEVLLPLVYDELRRLAAAKMAKEAPGQTLQATALVHEAWLKLADQNRQNYNDRQHFFRAAAEAMRRILTDNARRKRRLKRGDGKPLLPLSKLDLSAPADEDRILLVNEALDLFAQHDPEKAEIVKLRYFAGLSHLEISNVLGLSEKTVRRHWNYAKIWLLDAVENQL